MPSRQPLFGPSASVVRAVDLVNEAGPPAGPLATDELVSRLTEVLRRHREDFTRRELLPHAGPLAGTLALLHSVLAEADVDRAAARMNALLAEHTGPLRLAQDPGTAWHLHADAPDAGPAGWLAASSLIAMAVQFAEHGEPAWGRSQAAGCERFYVRGGPGRPRTTCSPACAGRRRQAEFRARRRAAR